MRVTPIGKKYQNEGESDIFEINDSHSSLRIIVDTALGSDDKLYLEIVFIDCRGYRYLDEGDLLRYWETDKFKEHYIYEILSGGWISGEVIDPGVLNISQECGSNLKEWFIVTTNGCINVLAINEPLVRELRQDA